MSVSLSPIGGVAAQFFDNNGNVLAGGKLYSYEAGTTTPKTTYTSYSGTIANSNPIILTSAGRIPYEVWLTTGDAYKFVLTDSIGNQIGTWDNIYGYSSGTVDAQTEVQYATAGQTLFVLTGMAYTPGANTLGVYVDGVNQVVGNAYVETNATSVTFVSGLHEGATVKFINLNIGSTDASVVSYEPGLTGSVATTVQAKLRESISVLDFGADPTGVADSTAAIQAALDAVAQYGNIFFPEGTYITSSQLTLATDNVLLYGNAVIKAKDSTNFVTMLSLASTTGVSVNGLIFDANKAGRASGQTGAFSTVSATSTIDCSLLNCTFKNTLGYGGSSTVAVEASGGALRLYVSGCKFLSCGDTATNLPSDGIFVRGDYCIVENCYAKNVTDTSFVLEGSNYSRISNCVVEDSTCFAAISNDTGTDCVGSQINDITGSINYVGSTGGVIGIACFGAGDVLEASVSNVSVRVSNGAGGMGPITQVRTTSTGRVVGLTLNNISVDSGATSGVVAQAFLIEDSDDVQINNPFVKMDTSLGSACAKFQGDCTNGIVNGGYLEGADYGVTTADTAVATVQNVLMGGQNTATIGSSVSSVIKSNLWQSWTPTYSSDIGDASATFTGTPTTTLARYSISGNTCTVVINWASTLKAVSPAYIDLTLPSSITVAQTNTYSSVTILNDATYETGQIRSISGALRCYRNGGANFSTNANVEGITVFTFEVI
jgi:hypothetical protein